MAFNFKLSAWTVLLSVLMLAPMPGLHAAEAVLNQDGDDAVDEPPPEGYEERIYPVSDLTTDLQDYPHFGDGTPLGIVDPNAHTHRSHLSVNDIIQVIKVCSAPESWNKRGAARISSPDSTLVILQKPEVHEEIGKILNWLREGSMAPFRGTLVAVKLSPELATKLAQTPAGAMTGTELLKMITDAGADSAAQIVDVNGFEGQSVSVLAGGRFRYVHDFDVAGAVYDPVMQQRLTGLRLAVTVYRSPDCKDVQMDFHAELDRNLTLNAGHMVVGLEGVQNDAPAAPTPKDEKEKPPVVVQAPPQIKGVPGGKLQKLNIDLPTATSAELRSTIGVAQGKFGFAGMLDLGLCNADGKPELLAFFARASVGGDGVPALTGVSGLKADEIFKLYPTQSLTRTVNDFPSRILESMDTPTIGANAFANAPTATENTSLRKAKTLFQEQVRKDKLVEPLGPVIFTRLKDADHQKLAATLNADFQRRYMPLKLHAVAVSMASDKARKALLEGTSAFDWAAIQELSNAPGSRVIMNESFGVLNQQRTSLYAGIKTSFIGDYDINGDSHDPVIRSMLDRGFSLDVRPTRGADRKNFDLLVHFQVIPQLAQHDHKTVDGYTVNSGAMVNLVMSLSADIDLPKVQFVDLHEQVSLHPGQYVLAGSATSSPEEEKAEPRQTLLFVRLDDVNGK